MDSALDRGCRLLTSFVAFRSLYYGFGGCTKLSPGFASRFASSCHCVCIVLAASSYLSGIIGEDLFTRLTDVSLGYLAHDLLAVLCTRELFNCADIAHHALFAVLIVNGGLHFPRELAQGLLAETSPPFLYAGWGMIKLGRTQAWPRTFRGVAAVGVALFFMFRVVNFTHLLWFAYLNAEPEVTGAGLVLTVLNYYWFVKLLRKACNPMVDEPPQGPKPAITEAVEPLTPIYGKSESEPDGGPGLAPDGGPGLAPDSPPSPLPPTSGSVAVPPSREPAYTYSFALHPADWRPSGGRDPPARRQKSRRAD